MKSMASRDRVMWVEVMTSLGLGRPLSWRVSPIQGGMTWDDLGWLDVTGMTRSNPKEEAGDEGGH